MRSGSSTAKRSSRLPESRPRRLEQHVAEADPRLFGRTARLHARDEQSDALPGLLGQSLRQPHRLAAHAEVGALNPAVLDQARDHSLEGRRA